MPFTMFSRFLHYVSGCMRRKLDVKMEEMEEMEKKKNRNRTTFRRWTVS